MKTKKKNLKKNKKKNLKKNKSLKTKSINPTWLAKSYSKVLQGGRTLRGSIFYLQTDPNKIENRKGSCS